MIEEKKRRENKMVKEEEEEEEEEEGKDGGRECGRVGGGMHLVLLGLGGRRGGCEQSSQFTVVYKAEVELVSDLSRLRHIPKILAR